MSVSRKIRSLRHRIVNKLHFKLLGGTSAARAQGVTVGDECHIYTNEFGTEPSLIKIGERVTISSGVALLTHDGAAALFRDESGRRFRFAPIEIGNDVFVGIGSILLPGVNVGDRCVIAAGAVVTKSVPSGTVVAGNPARIVGSFEDFSKKIARFPSEAELNGLPYLEKVHRALEKEFRPALERNKK